MLRITQISGTIEIAVAIWAITFVIIRLSTNISHKVQYFTWLIFL
jgi:hypothetical protein